MKKLQHLSLRYHALTGVPDGIKELTNLSELDLSDNPRLKALSAELGGLPLKRESVCVCVCGGGRGELWCNTVKTFNFVGTKFSSFYYNGHVRRDLNLWILYCMPYKLNVRIFNSWIALPMKNSKLNVQPIKLIPQYCSLVINRGLTIIIYKQH